MIDSIEYNYDYETSGIAIVVFIIGLILFIIVCKKFTISAFLDKTSVWLAVGCSVASFVSLMITQEIVNEFGITDIAISNIISKILPSILSLILLVRNIKAYGGWGIFITIVQNLFALILLFVVLFFGSLLAGAAVAIGNAKDSVDKHTYETVWGTKHTVDRLYDEHGNRYRFDVGDDYIVKPDGRYVRIEKTGNGTYRDSDGQEYRIER